jgi:hypothetical protein
MGGVNDPIALIHELQQAFLLVTRHMPVPAHIIVLCDCLLHLDKNIDNTN